MWVWHTRGIETGGYLPSCYPTEHRPTRELCLPCGLFGASSEQGAVDNRLCGRLHRVVAWHTTLMRQHLKVASCRMTKAWYDCLINNAEFQEGDEVWFCCLTWTIGKWSKLRSWEGLYSVITQINDVCWIQQHPRAKMMVVLPWQTGTMPEDYSEWVVALRREQYVVICQQWLLWLLLCTITLSLPPVPLFPSLTVAVTK
jgi:hypothetical protein